MKRFLLLPIIPLLASCGTITPYGAGLAGTDADHIVVEGNSQTGAWKMEATGLNQSKSTDKVATTFKDLATIKGWTKFGTEAVDGGGVISEFAD